LKPQQEAKIVLRLEKIVEDAMSFQCLWKCHAARERNSGWEMISALWVTF
jgi:hypothetical protein